jgi:hypothetical protein
MYLPKISADFVEQREMRKRNGTLLLAHSSAEIKRQQDLINLPLPHQSDHLFPILLKLLIVLSPDFVLRTNGKM